LTASKRTDKPKADQADAARRIAAEHCLLRYATLYTAGCPSPGSGAGLWRVPIIVSHPCGGVIGSVGDLIVDVVASKVAQQPSHAKVLAAGKTLALAWGIEQPEGAANVVPSQDHHRTLPN
jgi:hypothetical protein